MEGFFLMIGSFRRVFFPEPKEEKEDLQAMLAIWTEQKEERGCSTCKHCIHQGIRYPGFVTAEENECEAGLQCDTVLFLVKNCEKYLTDDTGKKLEARIKELDEQIGGKAKDG